MVCPATSESACGDPVGYCCTSPGLATASGLPHVHRVVRGTPQPHRRAEPARQLPAVLRVEQVDADEVGEGGHAHLRQLLSRPDDVEGAADAHAGLVDQLEPLACEVVLGEVVGGQAHAPDPAVGVDDRRHPGQPGVGL